MSQAFLEMNSTMRYYLIKISTTCIGTNAVDEEGRFVEVVGSPRPWEVARAFVTVPYSEYDRNVESADELCDTILLGLDWLISESVVTALKTVAIDPRIGFLPTVVRNRKGDALATYYFIYSRGCEMVLDVERSGAVLFRDGSVDELKKWVMDRKSMPGWDLFLAHDVEWVASDRVRDLVNYSGFRGIKFRKVTCS